MISVILHIFFILSVAPLIAGLFRFRYSIAQILRIC